ncbi:MFS transporter small subunit [Tautonia marina]|uniref:MFS transporter small subunit n=1 Tax=Tautonia marina TaxID=2653855 RepID=UPI0012608BB6|nr:oxalate:formate antiporter [Tautonia marina]
MTSTESGGSLIRLVVYWTLVLIPLGWGISRSVVTSLPLFSATESPVFSPSEE